MEGVSSRHSGTLDGRLSPLSDLDPAIVEVKVEHSYADTAAVQHAAWMAVNMLARLEGVVSKVLLTVPEDIPLAGHIVPWASRQSTLSEAILLGGRGIGILPVVTEQEQAEPAYRLVIGPGKPVTNGFRIYGEAWWGGLAMEQEVTSQGVSALPFGPYLAACFGVAQVFKAARAVPGKCPDPTDIYFSLWNHRSSPVPPTAGPADISTRVDYELAGVGAVGCAALHALWATPGLSGSMLLTDSDEAGVDVTNLNRYLLFGKRHIGLPKASAACKLLRGGAISWQAFDGSLEASPGSHRRILCAVDKNQNRLAVQSQWPTVLVMASTYDFRAEVVRCDPRADGPCARCFNSPEAVTPDEELRRKYLSSGPDVQLKLAAEAGVSQAEASRWAQTGECGTAGEGVMHVLRRREGSAPLWAVPFVSCAAGAMLAAEAVKEHLDAPVPLSPSLPRSALQFWNPSASLGARHYLRDANCPMCAPATVAAKLWRRSMAQESWRGDGPCAS